MNLSPDLLRKLHISNGRCIKTTTKFHPTFLHMTRLMSMALGCWIRNQDSGFCKMSCAVGEGLPSSPDGNYPVELKWEQVTGFLRNLSPFCFCTGKWGSTITFILFQPSSRMALHGVQTLHPQCCLPAKGGRDGVCAATPCTLCVWGQVWLWFAHSAGAAADTPDSSVQGLRTAQHLMEHGLLLERCSCSDALT